jgi:hypothetical protein
VEGGYRPASWLPRLEVLAWVYNLGGAVAVLAAAVYVVRTRLGPRVHPLGGRSEITQAAAPLPDREVLGIMDTGRWY